MKLHKHFYVAIAILAVSTVLSEVYFRWLVKAGAQRPVPLAGSLSSIPLKLGDWGGEDVKIRPDVLLKIGAEDVLERTYRLGNEEPLQLYIAYFGGVRGTAPHNPTVCRPGGGFKNISSEILTVKVPGFGDDPLRVHTDLYERHFEKQVVVWWEYIHGRNVANRQWQRLLWALPECLGGKRGSVLQVQIALGFRGSLEESLQRITGFMDDLGPHVRQVLPGPEVPEQVGVISPDSGRH